MKCMRCEKVIIGYRISFFNLDKICTKCEKHECNHPHYKYAREVELKEAIEGNRDFPGVYHNITWEEIVKKIDDEKEKLCFYIRNEQNDKVFDLLENHLETINNSSYSKDPVFVATRLHNDEALGLLIDYGFSVNEYSFEGRQGLVTPLHVSVFDGKESVIKMLIESGADVNALTKMTEEPHSIVDIAKKREDLISCLLDYHHLFNKKEQDKLNQLRLNLLF